MSGIQDLGEFDQMAQSLPAVPLYLHYSAWNLIKWIMFSPLFAALSGWMIAKGGIGDDFHGCNAGIIHLPGPKGTQILFGFMGMGSIFSASRLYTASVCRRQNRS